MQSPVAQLQLGDAQDNFPGGSDVSDMNLLLPFNVGLLNVVFRTYRILRSCGRHSSSNKQIINDFLTPTYTSNEK